jgi:hypothetical protein
VGEDEETLRFRLYMLLSDKRKVFLTDNRSFDEVVDAMRAIFHVLWMRNALYEISGFEIGWGDD